MSLGPSGAHCVQPPKYTPNLVECQASLVDLGEEEDRPQMPEHPRTQMLEL